MNFGVLARIAVSGLAAAVIASFGWSYAGRLQDVPDAATPNGKIHCVSYTPFRGYETPFDVGYRVSRQQIEQDLAILAHGYDCVRSYSTDQGLDQIVPVAREKHMKVMLGAWLGRDRRQNDAELKRTIALARDNPDVVTLVIAGNEVLLRGDLPRSELMADIRRVKAAVPQPVTTADVWEFWLKNRELADAVDFITIHILPYWENDPTPAEGALDHLAEVMSEVAAAFPGKHIVIGETGWPSFGRMRQGAMPSLVAQAIYLRGVIAYAEAHGLDYNLFSAFDEPWKEINEGRVGGHWGVYTEDRHLKQQPTGPVSNHPAWRRDAAISSGLAFLLIVLCFLTPGGPSWRAGIGLAPFAALAGSLFYFAAADMLDLWPTVPNFGGRLIGLALIGATSIALGRHWMRSDSSGAPAYADEIVARLHFGPRSGAADWLGIFRLVSLIGAAAISFGLILDPRYRDFPIEIYLVPALGFAFETLRQPRWAAGEGGPAETVLCWLVIGQAPVIIALEGLENTQATSWALVLVLLGIRILAAGRK